MLSQKKTNCNLLVHLTWTCHYTNFWIAEGLLHSFKSWRLWREPVVGCHQWLWKEMVVMCGNWNVRQAMSQQVLRVTTFCSHFNLGNQKVIFNSIIHIYFYYLCYLRRKQTIIYLSTPPENVTTLTSELQKVCCILSKAGGSEESQLWVVRTGCNVWQLECQASNVTASVKSDHFLC